MRARNIKPGLYKDEELAMLPVEARYLFPGLWLLADCAGRFEDRPMMIKAEIYPYDDAIGTAKVHHLLQLLHDAGFITRYTAGTKNYIEIFNFVRHQNPHKNERDKGSVIPAPIKSERVRIKSEPVPNNSGAVPIKAEPVPSDRTRSHDDLLNHDLLKPETLNQPLRASGDAPECDPPASVDAPPTLALVVTPPAYGKAWFNQQHDAWYEGAYWRKVNRKASRVQYELAVKRLVAGGKTHEESAQFLFDEAIRDRERFEPTEDWQWRRNLHPERWLKKDRWGDDAGAPPLLQSGVRPQQKNFVNDVIGTIQDRIARGEKAW